MEMKLIEIRDRATMIPALAIRLSPTRTDADYPLRRAGYDLGHPAIMLTGWRTAKAITMRNLMLQPRAGACNAHEGRSSAPSAPSGFTRPGRRGIQTHSHNVSRCFREFSFQSLSGKFRWDYKAFGA
jgi:hypothetical protein